MGLAERMIVAMSRSMTLVVCGWLLLSIFALMEVRNLDARVEAERVKVYNLDAAKMGAEQLPVPVPEFPDRVLRTTLAYGLFFFFVGLVLRFGESTHGMTGVHEVPLPRRR